MAAASAASLRLAGQRVLVTGAGRGIGRAIARICQAEGARVAITSRTQAELEETAAVCTEKSSSNQMLLLPDCDVTQEDNVEAMVKEVMQQFGGLDILINNAGGAQPAKGPVSSLKSEDLRNLLDLNVVAVHTVTSAVLRHCSDGEQPLKRIINISSRAAKIGIPQMSFYVASKFALEGYSATLAEELRDQGVLVNTLSPGMVDTLSFPKAAGKPGVRTPESVENGLLLLLQQTQFTGHYLHVDELDEARAKGLPDTMALKPINEPKFSP